MTRRLLLSLLASRFDHETRWSTEQGLAEAPWSRDHELRSGAACSQRCVQEESGNGGAS